MPHAAFPGRFNCKMLEATLPPNEKYYEQQGHKGRPDKGQIGRTKERPILPPILSSVHHWLRSPMTIITWQTRFWNVEQASTHSQAAHSSGPVGDPGDGFCCLEAGSKTSPYFSTNPSPTLIQSKAHPEQDAHLQQRNT